MAAALFPSFCVGWFAAGPRRRGWRAAWRRSSGCKKRLPLVAPEETKTLREFETTGIAMRRCATEQHALDEEVQRVRALLHFNVLREMSVADFFQSPFFRGDPVRPCEVWHVLNGADA